MSTVVSEARKALARLRRAIEKSDRELRSLSGSIRHAEGGDFPEEAYEKAHAHLGWLQEFIEDEARRLEAKVLEAGGLEPGRVRRSSSI